MTTPAKTPYTHRPLFGLAVAFAVGIALSCRWSVPIEWGWALVLCLSIVAFIVRGRAVSMTLYALFLALGFSHATDALQLPANHIAYLHYDERDHPVVVEGVIASDVDVRQTLRGTKTAFELDVRRVDGRLKNGKTLVNLFRREHLSCGQLIRIEGKFHKPFPGSKLGNFSYDDYLKRNGVYWILSVRKNAAIEILAERQGWWLQSSALFYRHRCQAILDRYLNDLEAGVIQSLVLGGKYHIPDVVRQVFVETGTAHILAISGMNIGAVALLFVIVLSVLRTPRRPQLLLTIICLAAYAYMAGGNPSVVRAVLMAAVFLAGFLLEREQESLNSLGLAALIILFFDPPALMDIGFQLSFAGVFSIMYFYPIIYASFPPYQERRWMAVTLQALCLSLAAWIGVAPLIAYYFQILTPVTILANLPIIPFVSALMMLGIGLIATGFFSPWLASSFAACIKVVLVVMMVIIEAFAQVPWGHWAVTGMTPVWMCWYYTLIFLLTFWLGRRNRLKPASDHAQFLS